MKLVVVLLQAAVVMLVVVLLQAAVVELVVAVLLPLVVLRIWGVDQRTQRYWDDREKKLKVIVKLI